MNLPRLAALVALTLIVGPAALYALGRLGEDTMKLALLVGTVLWFAAAPRWLKGGPD